MRKFDELLSQQTNGANYDLETDQIVAKLTEWDQKYGIDISEVGGDRVTVSFKSLPEELASLAAEIYEFCPDTIDQGYGCVDEMIDAMEEMGQEIPANTQELVAGVDLSDENYGLILLAKDLKKNIRRCCFGGINPNPTSIVASLQNPVRQCRHRRHVDFEVLKQLRLQYNRGSNDPAKKHDRFAMQELSQCAGLRGLMGAMRWKT